MNDLLIIEAIQESCKTGKLVKVKTSGKASKPDIELVQQKPAVSKPKLINVKSGSK